MKSIVQAKNALTSQKQNREHPFFCTYLYMELFFFLILTLNLASTSLDKNDTVPPALCDSNELLNVSHREQTDTREKNKTKKTITPRFGVIVCQSLETDLESSISLPGRGLPRDRHRQTH